MFVTRPRYEPLEIKSRLIFQLKITASGTNYAALSSTSPDGTAFFIVRIRCFLRGFFEAFGQVESVNILKDRS
jgi:hypothetical protein